jgi:hypothetical protein
MRLVSKRLAPAIALITTMAGGLSSSDMGANLKLGIGSNYQFLSSRVFIDPDLDNIARMGIRHTREDVHWNYVQPAPNVWVWHRYDDLFREAAARRVRILPILGYGNPWATSADIHVLPSTEQARASFARYAAAVVQRYGPNGEFWSAHPDLPAEPVTAVEIWNEPWFPGPTDPTDYVALVQASSAAVRAVEPDVRIVVNVDQRVRNVPAGGQVNWASAVLNASDRLDEWVDVWSIHPYARPEAPAGEPAWRDSVRQVKKLRRQLKSRDLEGEVWITELGFLSRPTPEDPTASEASAKENFAEAMDALSRLNDTPNPVARVYAFTIARPNPAATPATDSAYGYSLVRFDGSFTPALKKFTER